jgi:predicted RNA binding protein YcfA (HicA-like mRNA interferase family)
MKGTNTSRIRIDYKMLIKFLKSIGYVEHRKTRSSHIIYKHETTNKTIPVSVDKGIIPMGTLSSILREVGVTRHDLQEFLNK